MSEAPGQVLARTTAGEALARAVDEYLGRSLGRPTLGSVDWDEVAAAFLAEMARRQPPLVVERKGYDLEPPFGGRKARSVK